MKRPKWNYWFAALMVICCFSCEFDTKKNNDNADIPEVYVTSAMKNVMWRGELSGKIQLDTIQKKGLYGVGPQDYLQGEILINDGIIYLSKATSDSTQIVFKIDKVLAPFFVHSYVDNWQAENLPTSVKTMSDLQAYIQSKTNHVTSPFAFKLEGRVESAQIHIQNLPEGTKVSSPKEAHQGQVNYTIHDEDVVIIGFYSEQHQGIFTHHDSFLHMHLITKDESKMGHLDGLKINNLKLSLPKGIITK